MPLFGKNAQSSRTILTQARVSAVFRRVDQVQGADERWKRQFRAYLMGGMVATDMALSHIPKLASHWRGTDEQFLALVRTFSLHMISCWGRAFAGKRWAHCDRCSTAAPTPEDVQQMLEDSAGDMINLLGGNEPYELMEFRVLDAIFKDDVDRSWPRFPEFVISVAGERLGKPLPMPLDKLTVPLDSFTQLAQSGWRTMLDPEEAIAAALVLSPQPMFDWYQQNAA